MGILKKTSAYHGEGSALEFAKDRDEAKERFISDKITDEEARTLRLCLNADAFKMLWQTRFLRRNEALLDEAKDSDDLVVRLLVALFEKRPNE